ncbi:peptidase [Candidatus Arthromitus sp. SFB-rat-Yit]|uniref:peptidase n=1 Tax=Candidatus Arthromitus sp. SFB-rat-Yit TaxID=1041504 RepID=UPI000227A3F6|nr:peptidase [Candidatus Arthromitus sp. SFB-rat-Yit]BAK80919.1 type IV leader peptidase family protein [Candidatus Arthromitus sp. SFB-rat-Yit]
MSAMLNFLILKIIGNLDYKIFGLKDKNASIFVIYRGIFKDKILLFRICICSVLFIIFNTIILFKILDKFSFIMIYTYLKYYYLFLVIYIFAFIDYITYYVYTILSYPIIIFSLVMFILSFLDSRNIKINLETIILIGFLYLLINKFKFLGEGDFDILLIVALTLGVLPTIFIFYLSIIMSGIIGIGILFKNCFKLQNNRLAFVPFIFIATTVFIALKV